MPFIHRLGLFLVTWCLAMASVSILQPTTGSSYVHGSQFKLEWEQLEDGQIDISVASSVISTQFFVAGTHFVDMTVEETWVGSTPASLSLNAAPNTYTADVTIQIEPVALVIAIETRMERFGKASTNSPQTFTTPTKLYPSPSPSPALGMYNCRSSTTIQASLRTFT